MKKSKPKLFDAEQSALSVSSYGPAVRVIFHKHNRKWAQDRENSHNHYRSRSSMRLLSLAYSCIRLVPFPLRRLLAKGFISLIKVSLRKSIQRKLLSYLIKFHLLHSPSVYFSGRPYGDSNHQHSIHYRHTESFAAAATPVVDDQRWRP